MFMKYYLVNSMMCNNQRPKIWIKYLKFIINEVLHIQNRHTNKHVVNHFDFFIRQRYLSYQINRNYFFIAIRFVQYFIHCNPLDVSNWIQLLFTITQCWLPSISLYCSGVVGNGFYDLFWHIYRLELLNKLIVLVILLSYVYCLIPNVYMFQSVLYWYRFLTSFMNIWYNLRS